MFLSKRSKSRGANDNRVPDRSRREDTGQDTKSEGPLVPRCINELWAMGTGRLVGILEDPFLSSYYFRRPRLPGVDEKNILAQMRRRGSSQGETEERNTKPRG